MSLFLGCLGAFAATVVGEGTNSEGISRVLISAGDSSSGEVTQAVF